jgi:hypothetical protein
LNYTHTKFRISDNVAEFIKLSKFSAQTAKLLFALIFLQDQTDESWPTILYEDDKPQDHFVFVDELRELGFPTKTGSSRFLRKPVSELVSISAVFEHLQISENGRFLSWRFSENFFDAMADMDVYALIDASEIALCQRKYDGALLAQIPLHRKKRIPEFRLIGPNKGFEGKAGFVLPKLIPSQVERQLRPSLQNWANTVGTSFAVLLFQEGSRPGYTDVVVRMRHKSTQWPEDRFTKRPASALIWTVSPEIEASSGECAGSPPDGPPFLPAKKG